MNKIAGFKGPHRFLSNFWEARVFLDGYSYPTVEHAYQAAKTLNLDERDFIRSLETPGQAKRAGRKVTMRPDWDDVKFEIMYELNKQKFFRNPELRVKLIETRGIELEETNTWNDRYWGVCNGVGSNYLGKILMMIREELVTLEESMGVKL